eukprot:30035-Amphidinium_carterae.1
MRAQVARNNRRTSIPENKHIARLGWVSRALGNVPRGFRCYETNALFCVGLICSSSSDASFEAAASEGGVFANPTRTRFWHVFPQRRHIG